MTTPTNDDVTDQAIDAAREILCDYAEKEPRSSMSIRQLLDELGDRFPTTPAMVELIYPIGELWADPDIHHVNSDRIDFRW